MATTYTRVGVDVGGTFTDLAAWVDGELRTLKVSSVPHDQSLGVADAIAQTHIEGGTILAHGMTVATNALLERRGARTALITTAGFADVIEIARQSRADLYDLSARRPPPLVPRELRFTVRERVGPHGVLTPLEDGDVATVIEALRGAAVNAVAVCLLFSFVDDQHEQKIGQAIRDALPGVHVSLSSEVLPEFREYERTSTTVADAFLAPELIGSYAGCTPVSNPWGCARPTSCSHPVASHRLRMPPPARPAASFRGPPAASSGPPARPPRLV